MVYMMMGIQGSGKSTYSKILSEEKNIPIVSSDKLRQDFTGIKDYIIWPFLYAYCAKLIREGQDFIFDATNITKDLRAKFFEGIKNYGLSDEVTLIWVKCPKYICKQRARIRNKDKSELYLPIRVIDNYYKRLEAPSLDEGFKEIILINSKDGFIRK